MRKIKGRMALLLSKGGKDIIKHKGFFWFLKEFFSGKSAFKCLCLEKQKDTETGGVGTVKA